MTCILVLPSALADGQTRYRNAASISGIQTDPNTLNNNSGVTPKPRPVVTFNYSANTCNDADNLLPIMDLLAVKGEFTATPAGLVFASTTTGEINVKQSQPGNYLVTNTVYETVDFSANSASFMLTIHELPTISGLQGVCVGSSIQLTGSGTKAMVNPWLSSNTSIATIDTNGVLTGVFAGNCDVIYTDINGCTSKVNVTVYPVPTGYNDRVTLTDCSGLLSYDLQNNVDNLLNGGNALFSEFVWTVSENQNVVGAVNGSGNKIQQTLINTSNAEQTIVYTVTPKAVGTGQCTGLPFILTVTVPVCSSLAIHKTADITSNVSAGDVIHYTITVENNGNANQTNVVLTDSNLGVILSEPVKTVGDTDDILEKGEIWIYSGAYVVLQSDLDNNGNPTIDSGKIRNTASVRTNYLTNPISAICDVTLSAFNARVALIKSVSGTIPVTAGGVLNYILRVKNTGNVTLTDIQVTDDKAIISGNSVLSLAPGDSTNLTASHILTPEDILSGKYSNTALVKCKDPFNNIVTDISGNMDNDDNPTEAVLRADPPVAVDDNVFTMQNADVTIPVISNDNFGINGPAVSAIIVSNATHGTVTVLDGGTPNDPTDDKVIYSPEPGYYGADTFTYSICNRIGLCSTATVTVTVNSLDNLIQAFKSASVPVQNPDNTFSWKYTILLRNKSNQVVDSIHVQDDLIKVFGAVHPTPTFEVTGIYASGTLLANGLYNGNSNVDLLLDRSYLNGNEQDSIVFEVNVQPNYYTGNVYNQAVFEGMDALKNKFKGALSDDKSLPGILDPTQTTIPATLTIPDAFSPNGDGINDQFVILHSSDLKLKLEIYNRWGNRVYLSNDYLNDWDGKGTDNFLGQDLPAGTYYYILESTNTKIAEVKKYMNFLTLRR